MIAVAIEYFVLMWKPDQKDPDRVARAEIIFWSNQAASHQQSKSMFVIENVVATVWPIDLEAGRFVITLTITHSRTVGIESVSKRSFNTLERRRWHVVHRSPL